ncbi:MAG: amino acid adenylation domain-containing protein [Clostridiaceae bacterium]|nr:amino acid adenylation domain-containing protein [Clostridiaceae bacterium]
MINMQLEKNEDTINLTCSGDLLQRLREYAKDDPGIATIFLAGSYAISQILFMRREECRMRLLDSKDTFFDVLVQKRNLCDKNFYDLIKLIYQQKDKKIYSGKTDQELVLIGPYSYAENSVINKDRLNLIWFDNCFDDSDQRENPEFLTVEVPQMFQTPVEKNRLERGLGLMISSLNYLLSKPADEINKIHQAFISDQERIFQQFNDTQTPYPADSHIYEVFSVQVKKGSDRPALSYEGRDYSYGDLGKLVENRAKKLQGYGVGLGDIVSFIHKDKLDQIVSIFAILANGAAYLPIEPDYPDTRIRQMLEEALATGADNYFLLNDNRADKLQPIHQESDTYPIKYIYVDLADIDLAEITDLTKTSAFVVPDIPVDSPAYIMFTSGSTGSPKGVAVSHRNILRLVKNNLFLDVSAEDVFLQTSTVVFDASTLEIFCSLLNGAKFVLSHKEDILNASRLAEIIKKEEITTMWLSSPLFNTLCEVDSDMFRNLEHILIGGDALSVKHIKKLRESCPDLEIINGYGPTENTTFSCTFSLPQEIPEQIPVGQPIGNSTVYILDDELNILPVGSEGEICVGGAGVSLGYLNAEQLNQQKFVDNPFGEGKLFKTGDLGAWTEEGDVLFFGRMDSQMKINGYRVELSEIEFVAAELSGCDEVNVFVVDDVNDQKEIVLSYTGETGKLDLMQYLENNLPEFMLPHHYLHLAEFPLNQNGKLDRKRLMEIFRDESRKKTNSKSNMTELELAVFDILYGLDPSLDLAADTNLFSAGFDSLKLAMLLNRMQEYFHLDLQYQDIVKSPSISGLANLVTEGKATSMQIVRTEDKDRVLASEAQRRVFYASVEDSESLSYNIYALFQVNDVSYSDLAETFNHLVERHESLRSYFVINEGDLWQFFKPEQKTVVKTHLVEQKEVVDFAESLIEPFDLADPEENLFRLHWLETETSSYLLIDCHHIIVDGFSLDILIEDACSLLQGERLTNQEFKHRDYQYTKNIKLSAEKMESGRKFWTENLVEFEYAEDILPDYQKDLSVIGQEREGSDLTKEISAEYYEKILNFLFCCKI